MIRTVYIAAVLGIITFFLALSLGMSWGIVLAKEGVATLAPSFVSVGVGLAVGTLGFVLGLILFRTKKSKTTVDILGEVEQVVREDGRERASMTAN